MKEAAQEQLIAAKRNQILDAAAKVFAQQGFHPTTIRDVAREAGVADGTIYNYFANKTALLMAIFERMRDSVLQADNALPSPDGDLRSFIKGYLQHPLSTLQDDNFALFRVVISEIMVNPELRARYYESMLEPTLAMAEGFLGQWAAHHNVQLRNIPLTLRAVSSMVMGLMLERIMGDKTLEAQWDALPDFITDLIMNGIVSE